MSEPNKLAPGGEIRSLTVALVGPDEDWRNAVANMLSVRPGVQCTDISNVEVNPADFAADLAPKFDAVVLEVDNDPERAYRLAEALCSHANLYVMACSLHSDVRLAIRFMRTGVREFFTFPVDSAEVLAALNRAAARPVALPSTSQPSGKLFVFLGVKGGVGVTTLASNFALTLAKETNKKTLVIDLGLPLGDVAINLGMNSTQFSVMNALTDTVRLDGNFLETLTAKHSSGLFVLAAPTEFPAAQPPVEAFDKLLTVARQHNEFVVVDIGSRVEFIGTSLIDKSTMLFLITQVGVTELRNTHHMINQFFPGRGRSLQIVLNRYTERALLFDDAQIAKTLTRPADWKIPDDYAAARRTLDTATPLALLKSELSAAIRKMVRKVADVPAPAKKKGFFSLGSKG